VSNLFVFGTLRHDALREVVLGAAPAVAARLPGRSARRAQGGDWPVLVTGAAAEGLLIEGLAAEALARADFFERGFGYSRQPVEVIRADGARLAAEAYFGPEPAVDAPWNLAMWQARHGEIWTEAAREAMESFGKISPEALARRWPMIELRAATRLRAAQPRPASLRSEAGPPKDVEIVDFKRPYTNYFTLEEVNLRFRRFDGSLSAPVNRAGFVGGDAATVLPWDPASDSVLLVEQFRTGPLLRGDPRPWTLEPIAGRVDAGETPEAAVRREAMEEAGLKLGALHHVADYYPSPGAVTEYVFSYVAETDLSGRGGEIGGQVDEHEDIRAHVIPFEQLMRLITSGEAATGPLILSALWLERHRAGLRPSRG